MKAGLVVGHVFITALLSLALGAPGQPDISTLGYQLLCGR